MKHRKMGVHQAVIHKLCLIALAAALPAGGASAQEGAPGLTAVRADRILTGTGEVIENGVLLIEGGRIRALGADLSVPAGARVLRHAGVVMPGMIDLAAAIGSADSAEGLEGLSPEVAVLDGLNPWNPALESWLRAGITTVHLVPPNHNTVPGVSAVLKTGGPRGERLLVSRAALVIALSNASRRRDRAPTSLMGAVAALREMFARGDRCASVKRALRGDLPVWIHAETLAENLAALRLVKKFGLQARLMGAQRPGDILALAAKAGLALAPRPLDYSSSERTLRSWGSLGASEHPLGFASEADGRAPALRRAAALAVRAGLDPGVALKALTAGAAQILGVAERVGSLAPGKDADMVWLSGDPLDLGSRVVAVFLAGRRVDAGGAGR